MANLTSTLLHEIATNNVNVSFFTAESFIENRITLSVIVENAHGKFSQSIDFEGKFNYFKKENGKLSFPTSIEQIKNDFCLLNTEKDISISSKEMLLEFLMLVRLSVYKSLKVTESEFFNEIFNVDNMNVSSSELKTWYKNLTKNLI